MKRDALSRRDFLRTTGLAALGLAGGEILLPGARALAETPEAKKSIVTMVTDAGAVDEAWKINARTVERMVHEAVMLLTGQSTPEAAWAAIFPGVKADDVVGIKVNVLNSICPSHPEVALAVAAGLQEAGFKENNIIIWDRAEGTFIEGLTKAGYVINRGGNGVRCLGTNSPSIGYDRRNVLSIPSIQTSLPVSKLISQVCKYLVNIPVLKNHGITGMTGAMKSYYGAIPLGDQIFLRNVFLVHQNNGNPQIAELYANPIIKEKTRLHIADALMGIYKGGPQGKPQWRNQQIIAATDPVAMDYELLQIINAKRAENGQSNLDQKSAHIRSAEALRLGACNPELIDLRKKALA